jgi:hypothetical protein
MLYRSAAPLYPHLGTRFRFFFFFASTLLCFFFFCRSSLSLLLMFAVIPKQSEGPACAYFWRKLRTTNAISYVTAYGGSC